MANQILVKPLLTEKLTDLQEKRNQFAFVVGLDANKIEIKKAVESKYNVTVLSVNTITKNGKQKVQFTKKGVLVGKKDDVKKAIVTLKQGDVIDFLKNA